ncbi:hypothetical protein N7478_002812 [Penicillium angulare]|uniref:uncharacterized protein n=1 Tax=Penicillium angulare TaxID=116970 RepID=UPI0025424482|nr:uncharacterized protein N7478_002812 [Penicillium angulare]KAJ5287126.1 hypothetical protein N7478_002812 [Penicillium angulare]
MEEKRLLGDFVVKSEKRQHRAKHWLILPLVALLGLLTIRNRFKTCPSQPKSEYLKYEGENISWENCGNVEGIPVECSRIDVPMDQFNPDNPADKTFSIPIIRMRGQNATQNILINPGGPGGSGLSLMYQAGPRLKTLIGEGFHLVSFDPRGVNSSTPQISCYPDASTRQRLSPVRSRNIEADSPGVFAWTQNFVKTCIDTAGEHLGYVNTPQVAADMNSIIDALGQKDMLFYGISYGTIIGQTYAAMFPERCKRIIIDAVANAFEWYGEGFEGASSLVNTDAVLDGFFGECIKDGQESCSLAKLADSKEELRDLVMSKMKELQQQPLSVYLNNTNHGLLTFDDIWYSGFFKTLYTPQKWAGLADKIYDLILGNATDAFLAYNSGAQKWTVDDTDSVVELNDGLLTGPGYWPQDRQSILDHMLLLFNASLFDAWQDKIFYQRQQWTLPKRHSFTPPKTAITAHPILIMSTTYDPVCPLIGAHSANEVFEGSQVVEVKGYGHSTIAVPSMCVAKHMRAYLYEGKLPDGYTQCDGDSPTFTNSDEGGKSIAQKGFEHSDDRKIHLAQMELARNWEFRAPHLI